MVSRLYRDHGYDDGKLGEDISWLQQAPLWGFIIYRCDYRSDDAWKTFVDTWSSRVKSYLTKQYGDTGLVGKMLFTVKDDRTTLDNASIERVHKLFSEWIRSKEAHAERKAAGYGRISFPRYDYCVHVDAQALDTCLAWFDRTHENDDPFPVSVNHEDFGEPAYVNIVRAEEKLYLTSELTETVREVYPEDEEFEDDEEDKGPVSVKMQLSYVVPAVYTRMSTLDDPSRWANSFHRDNGNICSL
ncbi:Nn.00g096150.m01.CDS01 [Neocucurbitaria sp. VM-36]